MANYIKRERTIITKEFPNYIVDYLADLGLTCKVKTFAFLENPNEDELKSYYLVMFKGSRILFDRIVKMAKKDKIFRGYIL